MGILLACLLAAAPPELAVQSVNGERATGALAELDARRVVLQTASGRTSWELKRVAEIRFGPPLDAKVAPSMALELVDGSVLALDGFSMEGGNARVKLARGDSLELPCATIRSARFAPPGDSTSLPWDKIAAAATTHDVLMVKKGNAVDYHAGVLHRVTEDAVEFELDGERLPVRRSKVFGLMCHQPAGRQLPPAIGTLTDRSGSTWSVRTMAASGDAVQWTTPSGISMRRPLGDLALLTLAQDHVVYLSDLRPDSVEWTPYFGLTPELEARRTLFAPRYDRNLYNDPLQMRGERYGKGLCIPSRTELVFRLPDRFARMMAIVGIDDAARPLGHVRLVIRGDDRVLLDMAVAGTDPPKPVELDLAGVRRLSVLVDFGDDLDVGDLLNLCDARLLK